MRDQVIAEYHRLLSGDPSLNAGFFARLKSDMRAFRMLYGDREIGVALRPHFLSRRQYELLTHCARTVARALDTVAEAVLQDDALMDRIGLTPQERRLALVDPGYSYPAINTRIDGFVFGEEVRFVEYNAENPSSLMDQTGLNQILFSIGAMQQLGERHRLRQFSPVISLLQSLVATWREWGGTGAPHVAIIDWADLPTEHEFLLLRNYFVSSGLPTVICTPDELEYRAGKLRRGDFVIDLVYKRIVIHELLSTCDESHPLIQAYRNHDVCLINPFRCKVLHKKTSFEMLTDESHASWFTQGQREVIHRCIPWTRRMIEARTGWKGGKVDLPEFARANRDRLVLKPIDDYGGRGIFFGSRCSESEWDAAIATALANQYVVQELVDLHLEEFPVFTESDWGFQPMYVDTNPFLFRGEPDGAMVRLSASPVVNVSSGGGETGFFVLEDEN